MTNNSEHEAIISTQVVAFAKQRGVPVVAWRVPLSGSIASAPESYQNAVYSICPELTQYFVHDTVVYITDNISPQSGIANGS